MSERRQILRPGDVAERWHCSEQHVRNLYHTGKLRGFKIGDRLLRFSLEAVLECEGKSDQPLSAYQQWKQSRESKSARRA